MTADSTEALPTTPPFVTAPMARVVVLIATVLATTLGARITVPMVPVPMTLQTFGLLVGAAFLGGRFGPVAAVVYLGLAAAGLPVLAGGGAMSASELFASPSAGYLLGFVLAAGYVGRAPRRGLRVAEGRVAGASVLVRAMLVGHAIILGAGWVLLLRQTDGMTAFSAGVKPYVLGAVVKSLVGAWLVAGIQRVRCGSNSAP